MYVNIHLINKCHIKKALVYLTPLENYTNGTITFCIKVEK